MITLFIIALTLLLSFVYRFHSRNYITIMNLNDEVSINKNIDCFKNQID